MIDESDDKFVWGEGDIVIESPGEDDEPALADEGVKVIDPPHMKKHGGL